MTLPAAAEQHRGALGGEAVFVQVRRHAGDTLDPQIPRFGGVVSGPERQHQSAQAGVHMKSDPPVMVGLEPGRDLGHRVDHAGGVGGGRAHHEHRVVVDRRQQFVRRHPSGGRVHLDSHETQPEQVRGLTERGVDGDRGDDRAAATGFTTADLPRREAGENTTLGTARGDAAEHVLAATEHGAHPVDDPAVDPRHRTEDRGVQPVHTVRESRGPDRELIESRESRVVHIRQDPAAGRGRVGLTHLGQPRKSMGPAVGYLSGQWIVGHCASIHRG